MGRHRFFGHVSISLVVSLGCLHAAAHLAQGAGGADAAPTSEADLFQLTLSGPPVWLDTAPEGLIPASPKPQALYKGSWDIEASGAYMFRIRNTHDSFHSGSTALGYFIHDRFSVNAAIVGYSVEQPDNSAVAIGFDLYARCYFITQGRFVFFGDIGGGAFFADKEVPERGTHFNFTPRAGLGIGYRIVDNVYLLGGVRYWHLSNAGIHGQERNPSFDSLQYYGSIMFTF